MILAVLSALSEGELPVRKISTGTSVINFDKDEKVAFVTRLLDALSAFTEKR
jgi:hypothetical protein